MYGQPYHRRRVVRPRGERNVHSVTEASRAIKSLLERSLAAMWVAGEVSTLRRPGSGHVYFTLKDERSQLGAILFRSAAEAVPFRLEDGMKVIVFGRVVVYEPRGEYRISVEHIEPKGVGAQQLALEQLKRKLHAEGLFDARRKRRLPRFPSAIALVTSATGAAVRDMLEVIDRRYPCCRVILRPVRVQGEGAAAEVARAIFEVGRHGGASVVLVGRGGGSQDDLWAFNDEAVARAIAACPVPVVSSVGHAIDTTVADLVADCRALTPTEAAELATPVLADVLQTLTAYQARLGKALLRTVKAARQRLDLVGRSYAFREPQDRIRRHQQRLDELSVKLPREVRRKLDRARDRVERMAERLEGLSPLKVLARGYSATFLEGESGGPASTSLTDAAILQPGQLIRTRLHRGEVVSEVKAVQHIYHEGTKVHEGSTKKPAL